MNKSAFEEIKESIIDSIKFSKSLIDLKERIETILQEYDLEEKDNCQICGISEDEYGAEFIYNKKGEYVCEEHLDEENE